eukprot:14743210-Alexandrium_andersonii.AAC.1
MNSQMEATTDPPGSTLRPLRNTSGSGVETFGTSGSWRRGGVRCRIGGAGACAKKVRLSRRTGTCSRCASQL